MANLKELRDERLRKLEELKQLGVNPYPAKSNRTHKMGDIVADFAKLEGQAATVAGRIVGIRKFGKLAFIVLKDASGQLQLFLKAGDVAETNAELGQIGLEHLNLLDSGDFIEASGEIIKSKTGEISVGVKTLRLLTKSLRPMPTAQDGFTNKEERMRRRYVDMNVNEDVRQRFIRRSKFWQATRDFLLNTDFTEVNVPVLEHTTGGADANPFVTHMDALDQDFYLRISHELPLKRLIGAGYEKVFDIGPRFRNENYSDEHLPEHVAMEWYWAYADWHDGMKFMEDLFKKVLSDTFGTLEFTLDGKKVDMGKKWEVWDYASVIRDNYGIEVFDCTIDQVKAALKKHNLEVEKTENISRGIDKLWKNLRKDVAGPVWLVNTPLFISPLSKADDADPRFVQRFQAVIGGSELCNGWSELNDPVDQLNRFLEQQKMRDSGDDEAQMLDIDYVEMLEYGMPPACGLGFSERVFWIFEGVTAREGVPFPQLRAETDEVTKAIYSDVNFGASHSARKPNTLSPSSELMTEEHRLAYQMVVILNDSIETGRVINASNHAVAGLVGTMHNPGQFDFLEYRDKTGELDVVIAHHPAIIFKSSDSKNLLKAYKKAKTLGIPTNAFIDTMAIGSSTEEMEVLQKTGIDDVEFWGLAMFGKAEDLKQITKNFQLWK
jgi:lysyl-tRNA synthetase class 2